jgi:Amt family ammonium transporter
MGTFILWFGWFGFNGGSTVALTDGNHITAGRCCMNTTIAGAFGGVTAILVAKNMDDDNKMCLCSFGNGILAGLVGITAGCDAVDTWAAVIIGIFAGIFMQFSTAFLAKLGIDDPLGAYPVHGANGIWGVISTGLFHMDKGLLGYDAEGTFSKTDGKGCMSGNIIGILAICAWITATIGPTFFLINKAGLLRVSAEIEKAGVDIELVTYDPALAISRPHLAQKENAKPVGPDTTLGDA